MNQLNLKYEEVKVESDGRISYILQPLPREIEVDGKWVTREDLEQESRLLEERESLTREEQERHDLLQESLALREHRMKSEVRLDSERQSRFSGISRDLREHLRKQGVERPQHYVWVDGAEDASGEIVFRDHPKLKRVFVTKGDPLRPEVIDIPEAREGERAKRPYYTRQDGKITVYVDGFSGSGTEADPWQVSTYADLKKVGSGTDNWNMDDYYEQQNSIDASDSATENSDGSGGYNGFEPIGHDSGTNYTAFTGEYDGGGYTIDDLYVNWPDDDHIGLFAYNDGTIKNLGLEGGTFTGNEKVGTLVGSNYGTITDSYATGDVDGGAGRCFGGLVGYEGGTTQNCYATGSVDGSKDVGGLMGYAAFFIIENCYATGLVSGNEDVGGLVGRIYSGTSNDNYWDTTTSGTTTSAIGTGKTTSEMQDINTFDPEWNIVGVTDEGTRNTSYTWNIVDKSSYPFLSWKPLPFPSVLGTVKISTSGGNIELPLVDPADSALAYSYLRMYDGSQVLAADLVDTSDGGASGVRVQTPAGVKSWRQNA